MPTKVKVTPQVKRTDGRTTDVQVEGDGRRLLCEDKLAHGVFQRGQLASYLKEVRAKPAHVRAVVIAPRKFIEKLDKKLRPLLVGVGHDSSSISSSL